jgi:hypothetical protein
MCHSQDSPVLFDHAKDLFVGAKQAVLAALGGLSPWLLCHHLSKAPLPPKLPPNSLGLGGNPQHQQGPSTEKHR